MQKWEYVMAVLHCDWIREVRYIYRTDAQPIQDWERQRLTPDAYLNQFGDQGWELIGFHESANFHQITAVFKRPKG